MYRQTAQGKNMSNWWIIVSVLCWYSPTESQTVHIVEHKIDWISAYQTCTVQEGRLPGVNIYDHQLKLKDLSDTKNISSPFWVAATYDIMDCNHCEPHYKDMTPDTFCQTITISSRKINIEWRPCSECYNFSCAFSNSHIFQEADWKYECKDWSGASQVCKGKKSSLVTRENVLFMDMVHTSAKTFWLDDMPHINLAPDIRMQDSTCFYSFNGIIHEGNCSDTSVTTVCILVKSTGMTHTTEYSITNKPVISVSTNRLDISHSYMLYSLNKATKKTSETQTIGLWPILGGALGGFVAIIIIVLMIIIVLRKQRLSRGQIVDSPKKEHNSMHQLQDDTCYETLDQKNRDSAKVYCALKPESAVINN